MPVDKIPKGFHAVTPLLSIKGAARMIDFLKGAFGAEELMRIPGPDGAVMHAELKIGDSIIMLGEAMADCEPMSTGLYVYVSDTDATYKAALKAGGESVEEPGDQFWGDRTASVRDFAGNKWWIATHKEDVDSDELTRRLQAMAA